MIVKYQVPESSLLLNTSKAKERKTRSPKEHHGSPCDGSVKSAGPLCCHTQMGNNQAHRTKCLWQDVGTISTGMLFIKSL